MTSASVVGSSAAKTELNHGLSLLIDRESLDAVLDDLAARIATRLGPSPAALIRESPWRLLTVADVSGLLGRSGRWVRDRVRDGSLPHVRLDGGAFAFDLVDVREFASARRIDVRGETANPAPLHRRDIVRVEPGWDS